MKRVMLWISSGIILTTMIAVMIALGLHDYNEYNGQVTAACLIPLVFLPVVVILIIAGIKKMYKLGRVIQIVCAPFYTILLFWALNSTIRVHENGEPIGGNPYIVNPVTIGCSLCLLATIILFNVLKDKEK